MINPTIISKSTEKEPGYSNCGSLTLDQPILVWRPSSVEVDWYDEEGKHHRKSFNRKQEGFTIQHEIDHNLGILITDRQK